MDPYLVTFHAIKRIEDYYQKFLWAKNTRRIVRAPEDFSKLVYNNIVITSNLDILRQFSIIELLDILTLYLCSIPSEIITEENDFQSSIRISAPYTVLKEAIKYIDRLLK